MKKFIALLFATIMSFSFVACGGEKQVSDFSAQAVFEDAAENVVFIVQISINPEFELHMDQAGNVVELKCLNTDAQNAFAGISVENIPFETALRKLLDGALDNGYITGNSVQINIAPYLLDGALFDDSIVIEGVSRVCDQFRKDTGIGAGVVIGDINAGKPKQMEQEATNENNNQSSQQEKDNIDDWENDENFTVVRDENGNIVKYIYTDPMGNKIEYNADKQIMAENFTDGTCTVYDSDGNPAETTTADGSRFIMTYHANGVLATQEEYHSNGNTYYAEFDTSGKQISGKGTDPISSSVETYVNGIRTQTATEMSGDRIITTYNADGTLPVEMITYRASGGYLIRKYEYNGTTLTKYTDDKDGQTTTVYDANGNRLEYFAENNFGYPVHFVYNPDGSATVETTMPDGTIATSYVDVNGNLIQ